MIGGPDLLPPLYRRARPRALLVGVCGMGLSVIAAAFFGGDLFFRAYLIAWLYWTGIGIGCLGIVMLHQLTGGQWGVALERVAEAGARTLPAMALAFVPILFWLPGLYPWARPEVMAGEAVVRHKALYLNVPFFVVRTAIYFACWTLLAWLLDRWSRAQDRTADPRFTLRMKRLSAPGVIALGFTASFGAFDWIMSIEPRWYSTIYGGMVGIGWMLSAFAFTIAVVTAGARRPPLAEAMTGKVRVDLGNLLMTFVILWMYTSFAQLLIQWSGNEREEVVWYVHRLRGGWQGIAVYLAVFQFLIPLLTLLFQAAKRRGSVMLALTSLLLFSHWIDIYWLVEPAFAPERFRIGWLDFLTLVGLGGLWLALFLWLLGTRPLLPAHDPELPTEVRYVEA